MADEDAAQSLMSAAFNLRLARHLDGAHDDSDLISPRLSWLDAPGVEVAMTLFRHGRAPSPGLPQRLQAQAGIRAELRQRQAERRAAETDAAQRLLGSGAAGRVLSEAETHVLLTAAAVDAAEADGYLIAMPPQARPAGRTLADVVVPEQQDMVPPAQVGAVLASIALSESVLSGSVLSESVLADPAAGPVVTTRAQFSYGPYLGARPKPAPEFIGATNRAARRRLRLAELDGQIAEVSRQREELAAELSLVHEARANSELARRELPRMALVTQALQKVGEAAARLSVARGRLEEARTVLDEKTAELDARARRLRRTAADRDMPAGPDEVSAVELAVAEFERAAEGLVRYRGDAADLGEDLKGRHARIDRLSGDNEETFELLQDKQTAYLAIDEELRVLEQASGAEYEQISSEISETGVSLQAARTEQKTAGGKAAAEHDKLVAARRDLERGGDALVVAMSELFAQAAAFTPYAHGDLRPLLGVTETAPWPGASQWPSAEQAAADLAKETAGDSDPVQAIRATLPAGLTRLLDAFTAATSGRDVTGAVIKNAVDQMWSAYREFENALKAGEDGYQAELTGSAPFIVEVATNEGRKSAATFAGKIAAELLGFRPTRHVPAEAGDTLVVAVEEDLDEATDSE